MLEKKIHDKTIRLIQDDITKRSTDAIVNAANSYLKHYGGVAASIVRKGGKIIQEESDKLPFVPVGSAVLTCAGSLPCKAIIHAVGPKMGEGNEDEKLKCVILNVLRIAGENDFGSISLPAISSGIFGFPKDRCAKIILKELVDHSKSHVNPKLIEICILDDDTWRAFKTEFDALY